jgi:hypothetical protein
LWRYPYRCQITNFSAVCETAGRFAHICAPVVPIISACCAALVLWNRLFRKEKLSRKHCAMILLVAAVS